MIDSVSFKLDQIKGTYQDAASGKEQFVTTIPGIPDPELLTLLEKHDVNVGAETISDPTWVQLLLGILPWLFIAVFFLYSSRLLQQRMGGMGGGLFDFRRSQANQNIKSNTHDHHLFPGNETAWSESRLAFSAISTFGKHIC